MAMTKSTKGLLALLGVAAVAGGGWYGWQHYTSNSMPKPMPQAATPDSKPVSMSSPVTNQDKLVNEVMVASGLTRQLAQLPEQIRAQVAVESSGNKLPPEISRAIERIVIDSFSEENIQAHLIAQLKAKYDQRHMQALLADLNSPLAKRMVSMETNMGTPEDQAVYFNGLSAKPLPPARINVLQQLDRASGASDVGVEIAMSAFNAMTGAMLSSVPAKREEFEREIEKQRGPMRESVRNGTMGAMAFIYREASIADIAAYAKIYETEHAKWFSAIAMDSLKQGIKNASKRTGERMVGLINSKGAPPTKAQGVAQAQKLDTKTMGTEPSTSTPRKQRKLSGDIQKCLAMEDSRAIAKCAEQYR